MGMARRRGVGPPHRPPLRSAPNRQSVGTIGVVAELVFAEGMCEESSLDDLLAMVERPAWMAEAKCRGRGDLFYVERGPGVDFAAITDQARQLCAGCPVIAECAKAGESEGYGLWAGMSTRERREARQRRRKRSAA